MNIIILSHERSLNKTEGLLNAYKNENVYLIIEKSIDINKKPYLTHAKKIIVSKNFDIIDITNRIINCDKIWCVSENLLPVQAQLESYYGIENLTPFAAEILSNKQLFDNFCRQIGLGNYVPNSITPTFHDQLDMFGDKEFFTKPDIGTGSNVFFPNSDQNTPNIEYRRWNNKHHFLQYLKEKNVHNQFFDLNKQGIYVEKFNFKACKIMAQEYFWSEEPSIIPIGYISNGKVNTICYLKTTKVKYGDILDASKTPIELHSNSKKSDIAKDLAVWIVNQQEIAVEKHILIQNFLQKIVDRLKIKELMFAGPDFHISNNRLIAIDFNPRPGQFMNILDNIHNYSIFNSIISKKPVQIDTQLLWGCAILKPGKINGLKNIEKLTKFFNSQNKDLKEGMIIPEFLNLQNKNFYLNLNIIGANEQELFDNYKKVNKLLQDCIIY
jgi:hypothetical protein